MNRWGVLFFLPIVVLLVLDPVPTLAMLAVALVVLPVAVWLLNAVLGPKNTK